MRAFIYTGGAVNAERVTERPTENDLVIAADSGWSNAEGLGAHPTVLMGDFDSLGDKKLPDGVEICRVPAEKDQTDTQLAVEYALAKGALELIIIGGLSGRLDHTLSNLAILEHLHTLRVRALITDGNNRVRYLKNDSALIPRGFTYLSLLAVDPVVKGVEVQGVKYPLKNAKLTRTEQYAVSNEITGNCAFIAVRKGAIYVVESQNVL